MYVTYRGSSPELDLVYAGLTIFSLLAGLVGLYWKRYRKPTLTDTPMLMSYYTEGSNMLGLGRVDLGNGAYYTTMLADGGMSSFGRRPGAVLYRVQLPFTSRVHLLAIPTNAAVGLDPSGGASTMEKVVLEGDFPDTFSLYADKGQGTQSRYILDPKAMVHVIDFCRDFNWEIRNDELYFVPEKAQTIDKAFLAAFIDEIRPAVALPAGEGERHVMTQYRAIKPQSLGCPVCGTAMPLTEEVYVCPEGHGRLLEGKILAATRQDSRTAPIDDTGSAAAHSALTCPACQQAMEPVLYAGTVTIDSCTKCPYRWLDAGELTRVSEHKGTVLPL